MRPLVCFTNKKPKDRIILVVLSPKIEVNLLTIWGITAILMKYAV